LTVPVHIAAVLKDVVDEVPANDEADRGVKNQTVAGGDDE
jgi:hypothetical protein